MHLQCPVGTYNSGGNRDECTECPFGFSTEDNAQQQVTADHCLVAAGYEADANGTVRACPLGAAVGCSTRLPGKQPANTDHLLGIHPHL